MPVRPSIAAAAALFLTICACQSARRDVVSPASDAQDAGSRLPAPIIPRRVLFADPLRVSPALSPDGSQIAFSSPKEGVLNVFVAPVNDIEAARPVTNATKRPIYGATWSGSGEFLLYSQDDDGDENAHIYRVDPKTGDAVDLTPFKGAMTLLASANPARPHEIAVIANDLDPVRLDLLTIDLRTTKRTRTFEGGGYNAWHFGPKGVLRAASRLTEDGGRAWDNPERKTLLRVEKKDAETTEIQAFSPDGSTVYVADSRGRQTAALVSIDVATGKTLDVLAQDPTVDVGRVLIDNATDRVIAASFNRFRHVWKAVDPAFEPELAYLEGLREGTWQVADQTADGKTWLVRYDIDAGPSGYYLYARDERKARHLFDDKPALSELPLTTMHPLTIKSRDGFDLVSYLTLPIGSDPDGDGRPDDPLPTVLLVHGGPWERDEWGYDYFHQWLSNRGYAVLSVNFRGSTGFTKDFVNAADLEWGGRMHDDLLDGVTWAIENHVAIRDRIAIVGGSYGGYATLVGLTKTPEVFACGVDVVGPSNLLSFLSSFPPQWKMFLDTMAHRIGDFRTEQGRKFLQDRSPINHVAKIERPLLVVHGANDPRVKQAESDQLVAALQEREIPVTYLVYPDEGHGLARTENLLSFAAITEGFLQGCIGGRVEPIGDDLAGASVQVRTGAEGIDGLPDALKGPTVSPESAPEDQRP